ncbi:hypothetical protein VP01_2759g2 [Puccinia sorghi]|uniref:Retrovirus-related Pol polyprotein from transposon TNT 1-94-like beta-barrel domain-containing protein n=1 Tax=Puccinia sorghi TaxID=27349 RepID=A0A0L6V2Z0_9BASI|nr:hypothetical protein VP01_2759g2 [Puccinia sorghi]
MVFDKNLFISLDESERGLINTSCGDNKLSIEGKGTISLQFRDKTILLRDTLYVPNIAVNLLSLHQLLLDQCRIQFEINHFEITKNNELYLCGCYHNNLPIIQLEAPNQHSHLSTAEQLHKALGHSLILQEAQVHSHNCGRKHPILLGCTPSVQIGCVLQIDSPHQHRSKTVWLSSLFHSLGSRHRAFELGNG